MLGIQTNRSFELLLLLVLGAGLGVLIVFGLAVAALPVGFDSDELAHARAAWDLTLAFRRDGLTGLWEALRKESFWPPFFPLIVSVNFHLFGPSFATSRLPALLLSSLAIGITARACYVATHRTSGEHSVSLGSATIALLAGGSTPLLLWNSSLCMIEALGLFFTALTLLALTKEDSGIRSSLAVGALLSAQLLTKYTFPALLLPGLMLAFITALPSWGELWFRIKNLLWILLMLGASAVCWWKVADQEGITQYLFDYGSRGYSLGLPRILFYFRAFFESFVISPAVGVGVIFLAVVAVWTSWRSLVVRFALFAPPVSALLFGLLSEQLSRHLLIVAPCLWFLAGLGWARIVQAIPSPGRRAVLHASFVCGFSLIITGRAPWFTDRWFSFVEHQPGWLPLLLEAAPYIPPGSRYAWFGQEAFFKATNLRWLLAIRDQASVRNITAHETIIPRSERAALDRMAQRGACQAERLASLPGRRPWDLLVVTQPASMPESPFVHWVRKICSPPSCQTRQTPRATLVIIPWDTVTTACNAGNTL